MASAEMITAISSGVVGLGSLAGTIVVGRAGRRTPRQESREDFNAALQGQDKVLEQQGKTVERQGLTIDRLEAKVERLEETLVEQKERCAQERREDRRLINALTKILRSFYRHNQALSVPDPVLDPEAMEVLEQYNIP